jgi:hypothetical protein
MLRTPRAFVGIACLLALVAAATVSADEPPVVAASQKPVKHPLATALLGTWKTRVSGLIHGTGTVTYTLGAADTVLLLDEKGEHRLGTSTAPMKVGGHAVYKFSEDGKTLTAWWIDNNSPAMVKVSGPVTESGFDMTGEDPMGKVRVLLQKAESGFSFRVFTRGSPEPVYTQTYERASGD